MIEEITKEELLHAEQGAGLVEFYTPSCPHCKVLEKRLEDMAEKPKDLRIYKMNVEKEAQLCEELGIRSVPVLIRFEDRQEKERRVGAIPTSEIEQMIK
ncbi:MAG: thioredoxin family protein [Clostridia bacterium]|nr:thioredoxin family protein [Clostridia bacterium]